jgi:uncharacterized membrane protein YgdD (TMEM256/DUF423 family)
MTALQKTCLVLASLAGFASVLAAAHAAHGLSDPQAREFMHTGATYAIDQGLAVFAAVFVALRGVRAAMAAAVLFLAGILLFSGSLWAVALGATKALAMATPVGGLLFLAGWLALAWACLTLRKPA